MPGNFTLNATIERWPIAGSFVISRGAKTEAVVVVATISDGSISGRGECVPYPRYGQTPEGVVSEILAIRDTVSGGATRTELAGLLPAGAARNAVDCALWDFEAKMSGCRVCEIAGQALAPLTTAYTISLGSPDEMAKAARRADSYPLLKLKFCGDGDQARLKAVRRARPDARLIVDANEAWSPGNIEALLGASAAAGVEVVEQPLPADNDALLEGIPHAVPICADESARRVDQVHELAGRYDAVNIKLDKAGGLTGALAMIETAKAASLKVMVGCMVSTSLAMAPAVVAAQHANWVDLDGPLLLARDRTPGLRYEGARVYPADPELWG